MLDDIIEVVMGEGGTGDADGVLQPMESEIVRRTGLHWGGIERAVNYPFLGAG